MIKRSWVIAWILPTLVCAGAFGQTPEAPAPASDFGDGGLVAANPTAGESGLEPPDSVPPGDAALDVAATAPGDAALDTAAAAPPGDAALDAEATAPGDPDFRTLDEDVQDLKQLAIDLNRDLFLLEEELLFPANTQLAVFVSMDVGEFFALDSIEIQLDGKTVSSYLYTEREVDSLMRGGVQRLYLGNIRAGEHELVAFFTGKGPHARDYRRGASVAFEKAVGPKYIELTISDRESKLQPEFVVREWE